LTLHRLPFSAAALYPPARGDRQSIKLPGLRPFPCPFRTALSTGTSGNHRTAPPATGKPPDPGQTTLATLDRRSENSAKNSFANLSIWNHENAKEYR
jgi:hypothetical protein